MLTVHSAELLDLTEAERIVGQLALPPEALGPLTLDLHGSKMIIAVAGQRISNALRRYTGRRVSVLLPNFPPGSWDTTITRSLKRDLTVSGLGISIARHATTVQMGSDDITDRFKAHFLSQGHESSDGYRDFHNLHLGVALQAEDRGAFTRNVFQTLTDVRVPESAFSPATLSAIIELFREAILNVFDHAAKSPLPADTVITSACSIRYYKGHPNIDAEGGPFSQYAETVSGKSLQPGGSRVLGYLELLVNDDGTGIAGRHGQDPDIYFGSKTKEEDVMSLAMRRGSSIKPRTRDAVMRGDPGYGFSSIVASIQFLSGFACVRTGRFFIYCSGVQTGPRADTFRIAPHKAYQRLSYMPGTLLQALIPVFG